MTTRRRSRALLIALYLNAGLLAAVLLALLARPSAPSILPAALAQNQPPIGGGAGLFVMPAQFSVNTWGAYLLDVDTQTLCAYQFYPGDKQLRLIAARNFRFDRRLSNFNTAPAPLEVSDLLDKELKSERVRNQNNTPSSPEAPKSE